MSKRSIMRLILRQHGFRFTLTVMGIVTLGCVFAATARAESIPVPRSDTTVAHWRFQKAIDGDVAAATALIEDSSGNDLHGRAIGGPLFRAVALENSSLGLVFDGRDDRILIPDHSKLHLTESLTLEAYIQIDFYPTAALSQIVFRGDNRAGFDPWYLAIKSSGQLEFLIADPLNKASVVVSPEPLPTGRLLHVAGTLDHRTGLHSLYVNGQRVASEETSIRPCGPLGGTNPGIGIGNRQTHSDNAFRGTIDEVRISRAALKTKDFLSPPDHRRRGKR